MAGRDFSAELFGGPAKPGVGRDLSAELFGAQPKEGGFFSNVGKLALEGGERAIGAAKVSPSVISGDVGKDQAALISEQLSMKPTVQPKELTEVTTAFRDEAEALKKAKGFTESVGPTLQFMAEFGKQALTNPKGVAYLTAQSAANMAPTILGMIGGGKAGAPLGPWGVLGGSIVGGFAGSAPMEIGAEFIDNVGKELRARNMEPTQENVEALLSDKAFVQKAVGEARTKGTTTAAVDAALTAGAGRYATGPRRAAIKAAQTELGVAADAATVAKRAEEILKQGSKAERAGRAVKRGAGAVGIDVAGGGLSEAAGQYAAYGEIDPESVALEMLGELGGSAIEVPSAAYATSRDMLKAKARKDAADIIQKERAITGEEPPLTQPARAPAEVSDIEELERQFGMAAPSAEAEAEAAVAETTEPAAEPAAEPTTEPAAIEAQAEAEPSVEAAVDREAQDAEAAAARADEEALIEIDRPRSIAEEMEGVPAPRLAEVESEVERLTKDQEAAAAERTKLEKRTAGTSLMQVLKGTLNDGELSELGGRARKVGKNPFLNLKASKGQTGSSMEEMVDSGRLDIFLPEKMRPDHPDYVNSESAEYIRDKLRNNQFYTYETELAIERVNQDIEAIERQIQDLLSDDEINKEIQDAVNEQRELDEAAAEPAPAEEAGVVAEREPEAAEGKPAEGELTLEAPTIEDVTGQEERKRTAAELDEREQIRKESEAGAGQFELTQEEGRQDTTGDIFAEPETVAISPEQERKEALDRLKATLAIPVPPFRAVSASKTQLLKPSPLTAPQKKEILELSSAALDLGLPASVLGNVSAAGSTRMDTTAVMSESGWLMIAKNWNKESRDSKLQILIHEFAHAVDTFIGKPSKGKNWEKAHAELQNWYTNSKNKFQHPMAYPFAPQYKGRVRPKEESFAQAFSFYFTAPVDLQTNAPEAYSQIQSIVERIQDESRTARAAGKTKTGTAGIKIQPARGGKAAEVQPGTGEERVGISRAARLEDRGAGEVKPGNVIPLSADERAYFDSIFQSPADLEELRELVPSAKLTDAGLSVSPDDLSGLDDYVADTWAASKKGYGGEGAASIPKSFATAGARFMQKAKRSSSAAAEINAMETTPKGRQNILGETVLGTWTEPTDTKMAGELGKDDIIYWLQDKMVDTKRVVQAITAKAGKIATQWNPYLQEELYHGRTAKETKDFLKDELRPLMQEMQKDGVTIGELEQYLHNRHAEAYNAQVAKVNPNDPEMQDGGSGITNEDARNYLDGLPEDKRKVYEKLAKRVDSITKGTRSLLVKSGLESKDTIGAWEAAFPDYVPLHREDVDFQYTTSSTGTGQGFDVRGPFSRRAMGSKRKVVDILANIAMQRERAIVKSNKNRVAQAVYGLAVQNPNPDFWLAVNPAAEKVPESAIEEMRALGIDEDAVKFLMKEPRQRAVDPKKNEVIARINATLRNNDSVLSMRLNGENRYVFFNPNNERSARAAQALKNLDADQLSQVMGMLAKVTRWFASVNTQYNPIFGAYNFLRDIQGAALQLSTTPLAGKQKEVTKNVLPALRAIYTSMRKERKGEKVDTEMAKLWEDFQKAGGQTGFRDMFSRSQERAEALQKEFAQMSDGRLKSAGRATLEWLSDYNDTMENAVRLAAYKVALDEGKEKLRPLIQEEGVSLGELEKYMQNRDAKAGVDNEEARKYLDSLPSDKRKVYELLAKSVDSVKDEAASIAKNLTVNFNKKGQVGVQAGALYAFFNAAVQGTTRLIQTLRGPAGKKIMAGGLLLGVMQAAMFAAAGFDEEEPPEFVRERNIVIPTGWLTGKDDYIMVPMPLGYHVIPGFSRIVTEWALSGFKDTPDRVASLTGMFLEAFNPIGNAGWSVQSIAPTFADPLVALAENRDWTGKPIARKDFSSLDPTPGYTRAKDTASWISTQISKFLNYASGGTKYQPGIISWTPDQIDYLIGQATGGIGRELLKAEQTITKTATGEELPPYKIPVVGRFYGETKSSAAESARFYKNMEQLNKLENEIKGRRENKEPLGDFLKENPEARLAGRAREIYSDVKKLRERREKLVERDAPRESVKAVETQITNKMRLLNEQVENLKK